MHTFHKILERTLLLTFLVCFVFVNTYIPRPFGVQEAQAGGATGGATEVTQGINMGQLFGVNAATTASAASDAITSASTNSLWFKENVLDMLAWVFVKNMLSQMTTSIVNWINNGFQGSPNFVTDLEGFLMNVADETIGSYIEELGGPLSFICSPFQLDVRIALSASYVQSREGQAVAATCTLSGALSNIESFMAGNFDDGGWEAWFEITAKPETYTPYGNLLAAQSQATVRILNGQNRESQILDFGNGFLSSRICEAVSGAGTTEENCFISTPGKVVEDALTFQLSTGPRTLITADEVNEIVAALFGQLTQYAITGAAGLLGLSEGTGHTYPGYSGGSLINDVGTSGTGTINVSELRRLLTEAIATETRYRAAANQYLPLLQAYANNTANNATRRNLAQQEANSIPPLLVTINTNITELNSLLSRFNALGSNPTAAQLQPILSGYSSLRLHLAPVVDGDITNWRNLVSS